MRLKKIKLAGFKSFVDPISIPMSGNLTGIVGPNGCGKSNIIDAVRWVMGEISAKHLRGDSMADVIFSGSSARKPVGKASVELIFDNTDGGAPGQYAAYAEIAIRREAGRDGQSDYFLNKTKCRRKDITDIFLGTGLGPRAYSIIEQGAVTRIIEAKPEDLRAMLEEAAGVSRYKERRRETETRIRHTRENMARVEDIRKELGAQLSRLQRQSRAASRYKELKQEERLVRAQLLCLRWRQLSERIQQYDGELSSQATGMEAAIAGLRRFEADIEALRARQTEAGDRFNAVQAEFYAVGAEIAGVEQAIQHARDSREQLQFEHERIRRSWDEASLHLGTDQQQLAQLTETLARSGPLLAEQQDAHAAAAAALAGAEAAMHDWQGGWERFSAMAAEPAKTRDIQDSRIKGLEQQIEQLGARRTRLTGELQAIENESRAAGLEDLRREALERDRACEDLERSLEEIEAGIRGQRDAIDELTNEAEERRGEKQSTEARLAGLRELQAAALGKHDAELNDWLKHSALATAPRLAGSIHVEAGWEKAVERVLGAHLAAVCVSGLDQYRTALDGLTEAGVVLVETAAEGAAAPAGERTTLLNKVRAEADLSAFLAGVYPVESAAEALTRRHELAAHESFITRAGLWVGRNWLATGAGDGSRAGMLAREREIETLGADIKTLDAGLAALQEKLADAQERFDELESERDSQRKQLNEYNRERAAMRERLGHNEARLNQLNARARQIDAEQGEIEAQLRQVTADRDDARRLFDQAQGESGRFEQQRRELQEQRDAVRAALDRARADADSATHELHKLEIERQATQTALDSVQQGIARLDGQLSQLRVRRAELDEVLAQGEQPELELKQRLEEFLGKRLEIEGRLGAARQAAGELEAQLRELDQARLAQEKTIQELRDALEHERIARQELAVRRETLEEQVRETGLDLTQLLNELPPEANEELWQQTLEGLNAKIERLGPINLIAIEEYEEQSQRKSYLDKQNEDLVNALTTLEDAIRKIDRETRTRFRETFDKVNTEFQMLFPRLFGGGHAYLELIGDDLLDSGVTVMARPPGKRNSTIHLLSGGEKALTAVSLLFAIFELNPAPFCLLDEVDAPLDDANVARYADVLKALSQKTQLVYITHNKISMEIAEVLIGVTMSEPGVSRLVAVDVEEALEMVAQ
ncbi:MAG: chromosome segregation protein SMC [Gammaproteobacteria bacterium]|nr:chromosome segregation protein SMC [Gammaproteobacteria bacterium]